MRKISVLHPSTRRASRAILAALDTVNKADGPIHQYIMAIEREDRDEYGETLKTINNHNHLSEAQRDNCYILSQEHGNCVTAINNAAKQATGDILVVMSDDFELPQGWDSMILNATEGKERWLLKTNDGTEGWIATFPIMDKILYEELGYVYNPLYRHMFADTDLAAVCNLMDVTITRSDIEFIHKHYTKENNKDEVNERNDKTWGQGEEVFLERAKNNFYVENPIGTLDKTLVDWIKNKNRKHI